MKFLDSLLGRSKPKAANLDALFAVPGAAIALEASLNLRPAGAAAVCFRPATGGDFESARAEIADLLALSARDSGAEITQTGDSYGYHWVVLHDAEVEDLVTAVHMVNATLTDRGFGPQLLASVFPFRDEGGKLAHLVYLYKRGTFYPFAPAGAEKRDNQLELQMRAVLEGELAVEPELSRWFPIWGAPVP